MPRKKTPKKTGPPFYRGIKPLIDAGLLERASDPLWKFLWFCEQQYCDKVVLQFELARHGVNVADVLAAKNRPTLSSAGSPGHHRKVFDEWYARIARDQEARIAYREISKNPPKKSH